MIFYGMSDIGKKRNENQDSFSIEIFDDDTLLCVVCDGMGGAQGGRTASSTAVRVFTQAVQRVLQTTVNPDDGKIDWNRVPMTLCQLLEDAAAEANAEVYARANSDPELAGMGTTLVAALLHGDTLTLASIGDSRIYMLSENHPLAEERLVQLSHDHSYVQFLLDLGKITPEEAATHPYRNIITRAIGSQPEVEADTATVTIGNFSCYILLCSDGLTNYVSSDRICDILLNSGDSSETSDSPADDANLVSVVKEQTEANAVRLCDKVQALIDAANEGGGGDNITAVVIHYDAPDHCDTDQGGTGI